MYTNFNGYRWTTNSYVQQSTIFYGFCKQKLAQSQNQTSLKMQVYPQSTKTFDTDENKWIPRMQHNNKNNLLSNLLVAHSFDSMNPGITAIISTSLYVYLYNCQKTFTSKL